LLITANRRNGDLKFYEFGKTYHLPKINTRGSAFYAVFLTGNNTAEQWNHQAKPVSFYNLKAAVDGLLERLNIKDFTTEDTTCGKLAYGLNISPRAKTHC
jgi:phenylalanyl-tRNA synthetase beta chain